MPKKTSRPNILLITTDQQRGDCVGYDGHPCVRTPHLDMLAKESTTFSQAYVDCPICIPARTTLVTGIQSHHYGCPSFSPQFRIDRKREDFLGHRLTAAGYQTCLVGKRHWHTEADFPAGFEQTATFGRYRRMREKAIGQSYSSGIGVNELSPALSTIPGDWSSTTWAVEEAMGYLEDRDQSRPWFLWLSLIDPHPPNVIHEPYFSLFDHDEIPEPVLPSWTEGEAMPLAYERLRIGNDHGNPPPGAIRKARSVYYGMIAHIDHQLGRLFGQVMRQGNWEDTAIVFSSDHGEQLFDHGFGFKGNFLDPSARVPLLMRLPHNVSAPRGVSSRALVQWADLYPTLCELAEAPTPEDIDGESLMPLLKGTQAYVRSNLHGQINDQHMFHNGRYKYLYFAEDGRELLFDKESDPLDEVNLAGENELTRTLREAFKAHLATEEHPHLEAGGQLLNRHESLNEEDRSNCLGWMGLRSIE